jgi:hypothetical protein
MEHKGKKSIKRDGCKLLLDALKPIGLSGSDASTEAYSNLDLTKVIYSTYKHSKKENL